MQWLTAFLIPFVGAPATSVDCAEPVARPDSVVIAGRVVDAADAGPVAGAEVRFVSAARTSEERPDGSSRVVRSSDDGCFTLTVAPGPYVVHASHEAYTAVSDSLRVAASPRILRVTMRLHVDAIPIEPLTVEARIESRHAGLYDRIEYQRRLGAGQFILREDIERHAARMLASVLQTLPGVRLEQGGPMRHEERVTVGIGNQRCTPNFYINGLQFGRSIPDLSLADVEAIEVYRSSLRIPIEYSGKCVIAIWLR